MIKLSRKLIFLALFILILYISTANVSADSFNDVQNKINVASDGDTVYLDNTTYVGSGSEITVNKSITIQGGNTPNKKSTLDAKNLNRIFKVTNDNNVSFINLILINGKTTVNYSGGGAVTTINSNLIFINCTFINSSTTGYYSNGGAIYHYGAGNVIVNSCSFLNSSTSGEYSLGGVIYVNSGGVSSSNFVNSFTNGNDSQGGAIYIYGFNVNLTNNKFNGSSAVANGGVMYNKGNLYLKNNTMENSEITTPNGGIEIYNDVVIYIANLTYLDNTTFSVKYGQTIKRNFKISWMLKFSFSVKYGQTIKLWANITDDIGNTITGQNITFIINGNSYSVKAIEGLAKLNFTANLNIGIYSVYGNYAGCGNEPIILRNGTLKIVDVRLNVIKVSDKSSANVGDIVTYIINVTNVGSTGASNVTVKDLIPNSLVYVGYSNTTSNWVYSGGFWKLVGTLSGGNSAILKLRFIVNGNSIGTVTNKVIVMSNETGNNSTNTSNNNVSLNNVSLKVIKVSDKSVANVGDNVTYTITVTNVGSTGASNVTVKDLIPNGLLYVGYSNTTSNWVYSGGVWKLVGVLNGGSNAVLKLIFRVNGNVTGTVTNKVVVKSNETGNNTFNASNGNVSLINVSLGVTKVSDKSVANVGDNVTYTITVTNVGSTVLHGFMGLAGSVTYYCN